MTHLFAGEYYEARSHLEQALALFKPGRDDDLAFRFGQDAGVAAMAWLSASTWAMGEVARAIALADQMIARIAGMTHVGTLAFARLVGAMLGLMRGDSSRAAPNAAELVRLTREHDLTMYRAFAMFLEGWARTESGASEDGLENMRRGAGLLRDQKILIIDGLIKIALAEAEAGAGDTDRALAILDEALATSERIGHRTFDAELNRVRGEMLLKRNLADPAPAEEAMQTAIAVAKRQATRSFELRAVLSLAKLYHSTARPADAHAVLAPALEGFAPTPEMPEIAEAQALLVALEETDAVKAEAAQRRRGAQLRVAYGNALIATRGFGAPETTEAFAAARASAYDETDAPERLAANYGLWASSCVRRELPSMRTLAAAFLREARPDSREAGVGHRILGATHWFAGEYVEARDHLELALALFQPGRDDDLAFRFGWDGGVGAMLFLAFVLWPLGDVARAVSLVGAAQARIAALPHIGTHAYGEMNVAMFKLMRGDLSRVAPNAAKLARLTREHDLPLWRAFGVFVEGLAKAESAAPGGGLADMRRGVELLHDQNAPVFDGPLKIALAEAEARAGDIDRALAILDEALATSDRIGQRAFDAELHRMRGEVLLKPDSSNTASAEEAFQAAIAVAQRQGTRAFGLRAAISLAKLYRSTGRPAEAHAVLAPALEGFTPTPEMPEIAEAQALLAALAETEEVRAGAAQRERRLDLQTSYGQALQLGKGFAAEETRAAFARVGEFARPNENPAARFAAYYAQCLSSGFRGEFSSAQEMAQTFLREAEADERATEAVTARRLLAWVLFYQGGLKAARSFFERVLADFVPERDGGDTRRLDGQAAATALLASVVWHLGEVDRARLLIEQATRRARELGHAATIVNVLTWNAYLEIRRNDAAAARLAADAWVKLAEEYGMNLYTAAGQMCAYWASGRLADPEAGASGLRQALLAYMAEGNKNDAPLFHGMLAELEAATRGPDSALALIDKGVTIAEETGGHSMDPYLHRLRGDILLKRDPADPAPAEDAYRTAIAIAKQQGARSYELLASLSLAKLYQSTGRPADAYAVLSPAHEGFSPTPEMPEIAEAEALLAALAETDEVKTHAAQRRRMAKLRVAYGNALIATRGHGASETTEAFARARESTVGDRDAPERLAVDYGLWVGSYLRGDLSSMRVHAQAFLSDIEARPDSPEASVAHRVFGATHWFAGEYVEARGHLERALALFQPERDDDLAFRFGQDAGVSAMVYLAYTSWVLGDVDRAVALIERGQERLANVAHIVTHANGKTHAALFELMRGNVSRAAPYAVEVARLAREHDLPLWRAFGVFLEGCVKAQSGAPTDGLEDMRRGAELLRANLPFDGLVRIALAEAEARAGDVDRALAILDEALATCDHRGYRAFEAELHRARGEILLKRDPANHAPAEEALLTAIIVAKQQATRSFELRAALSLAKLYQSTGRPAGAHAALAPALEGFSPTPEMPEIAEAQALLAALAESDEVKADEAHRQRLTHLQVAYGNALIAARGFGAVETTEAFAKARESAYGEKDAPERLAADYGLWVSSCVRGELPSMRTRAAAFLHDVGTGADSPEAGVAHRACGLTHWFAGEYVEARNHLRRALALFQPGRDDDLAFRFGHDAGVAAMLWLAFTLWPLGDAECAVSLVARAQARIAGLAHVATHAFGKINTAMFELMRGDHPRAAQNAVELARLTREHDLPFWRAFGVFIEGLARAASGAPGGGLENMRRGVELLREQNVPMFDGLLKIALAEAEARLDNSETAIAILDESLATSERTGHRAFDAELHRLRGELLLKRDPTNPAPAEEAFQTAITVAHRQGARSFGLHAAHSLAKLYQSTGRLADAHAVLSPALEGLEPTPEMPEIAQAQALLAG